MSAPIAKSGLAAGLNFPLWGADTRQLAEEMLAADLIANIVTLNPEKCPNPVRHRFIRHFWISCQRR